VVVGFSGLPGMLLSHHARRHEHPDLSDSPRLFRVLREARRVDIHWSETILDETSRNLIKQFGFTSEDADVRIERLEAYLPQRWSR
jgi:hypothetical protein